MHDDQTDPVYDLTPRVVPMWWKVLKLAWRVAVYLLIITAGAIILFGGIGIILHFVDINNLP